MTLQRGLSFQIARESVTRAQSPRMSATPVRFVRLRQGIVVPYLRDRLLIFQSSHGIDAHRPPRRNCSSSKSKHDHEDCCPRENERIVGTHIY